MLVKSIIIILIISVSSIQAQTSWNILAESKVSFKIKNAGFNVNGVFSGLKGDIKFSSDKLSQSKINATVETKTIDTGIKARDNHLRKDDYFYVDKYPQIKMIAKNIQKKGTKYQATFDLTIRNVTKTIQVPFTFKLSGNQASFLGTFNINRRDYGVGGWSMVLANNVEVTLKVLAKKE